MQNKQANQQLLWTFLGGAMAGFMDGLINFPWTSGKIFQQTSQEKFLLKCKSNPLFFYRGLKPYLTSIIPTTGIQFLANDLFKHHLLTSKPHPMIELGFSVLSGILSALISSPLEYLILTQQKKAFSGRAAIQHLFKTEGSKWLLRGYPAIAIRDGVYAGGMLMGADYVHQKTAKTSLHFPFSGEILAGALVALLTHPFDTIAKRQQLLEVKKNIWQIANSIYKTEGAKGFYAGFICRLGAVIGGIIVMSKTYHWVQEQHMASSKDTQTVPIKNAAALLVPEEQPSLSTLQKFTLGAMAGAVEVLIDHPLWSLKTRIQCGYPFTLNPLILYQGIFFNLLHEVALTATQIYVGHVGSDYLKHHMTREQANLLAALFAGVVSAFIACPTELIMQHQQKELKHFLKISQDIVSKYGYTGLYKGIFNTMLREAIYTAGFFGLAPLINERFTFFSNKTANTLLSGLIAGSVASLLSNPIDMMKTIQQAGLDESISARSAFHKIYHQHGWRGFFKGATLRLYRVAFATTIIYYVHENLKEYLLKNEHEGYSMQFLSEYIKEKRGQSAPSTQPNIYSSFYAKKIGLGLFFGHKKSNLSVSMPSHHDRYLDERVHQFPLWPSL